VRLFQRSTTVALPAPPAGRLWISDCQMRLAILWLLPSLILFGLMMVQTFFLRFDKPTVAWEWLIPTILPTISVIVGGIVHTASNPGTNYAIDQNLYRLCLWLSWGYLGILVVTLFLAGPAANAAAAAVGGTASANPVTPMSWLETSKLWITPLQAPVGIVLGVFFASSRPVPPAGGAAPAAGAGG